MLYVSEPGMEAWERGLINKINSIDQIEEIYNVMKEVVTNALWHNVCDLV